MDKYTKTLDIKLPTRWEDLYNSLSQGYSIDEVKAFCLFRWNKITILHRYSVMRMKEFLEENLGWQFCGIIADSFNDKVFRRNH